MMHKEIDPIPISRIVILDRIEDYPGLEKFISEVGQDYKVILEEENSESLKELAESQYKESESLLPIFSYDLDKLNRVLNTVESVQPYFITLDKSEFKESYEEFRTMNSDKFVPKILISSGKPTDLLELSRLFSRSSNRRLKYINGSNTPTIIEYKGIETFNLISDFNSGVLVPATEYDEESSNSDSIAKNKKYILQKIEAEQNYLCISYSVRSNNLFNLLWTSIEVEELPDFVKEIKLPESLSCNFYCEIEKHSGEFFINKIIQGLHPYIDYSI
jgi:hypothetical protein